jgi:tRNA pseudouridine55 synthase
VNTRGKYQLNKLIFDDFNRPSGIVLLNKPADISSHDLVDQVRLKLGTKKVGHAGALDVFSSGLMLILVGKATKMSNELLNWDKAYNARMVFGLFNYTQDPEGEILKAEANVLPPKDILEAVLQEFKGGYKQFVSIYSSVKVGGVKLRKILRDPRYRFEIIEEKDMKSINIFKKEEENLIKSIPVPRREILIHDIKLLNTGLLKGRELPFKGIDPDADYGYCDLYVKCSKGTYIRQLASDIARKLKTEAVLASLERCELGELSLSNVTNIESLGN